MSNTHHNAESVSAETPVVVAAVKRGRGRPKGSKNKPKATKTVTETTAVN